MKNNKFLFPILIAAAVLIAAVVVFFSTRKKITAGKLVKAVIVQKQYPNDSFNIRALTDIKYAASPERLERGRYLTTSILQCFTCHSPRDWNVPGAPPIAGKEGSGGTILLEDSTSFIIAPNITPDNETGAGNWTDDMFARAIREGVGHDGRVLDWQMPSSTFRNLSDEDLASVIVYVRSLPSVHQVIKPTKFPETERLEVGKSLRPIAEPVPTPEQSDEMKRGSYLVKIGECIGCHTSHAEYNHSPGIYGGGNHINRFGRTVFSANITTDTSGIAYGLQGFTTVLRTGKGGTLSPIMPWIAYKNMTDDDLKAIYTYLGKLPPAKHFVSSQAPFTHCAICGMDHGLGEKNKVINPSGIKMNPTMYDQYAGTYMNEENKWSMTVAKKKNKLMFIPWPNAPEVAMIPQSEFKFLVPGYYFPIRFEKDANGNITQLVEDYNEGMVFKKIN